MYSLSDEFARPDRGLGCFILSVIYMFSRPETTS